MTFRLRWASAAHVCPQAGAKTLLCSPRSPHPWRKASRKLKLKARLHLLCPCRVCVSPCPNRSQPRLGEGVPGADVSQLPLGAGRGAPAVPLAGQQLHLQLRLGPGAMTAGGGRPRETVEPGACRQGRGAAGPLRTHHLLWKLMPTSSSRVAATAETRRGGFPEAEAKSLFIYFAVPFVDMFRKEGGGGGRGVAGDAFVLWESGGNERSCVGVKVSAWPEKARSGAPSRRCVRRRGLPTRLHQQAGPSSPVTFLCPCRSPLIPAGVAEMPPTRDAASALRASPSDPSEFAHYPRGWSGAFWARRQQITGVAG